VVLLFIATFITFYYLNTKIRIDGNIEAGVKVKVPNFNKIKMFGQSSCLGKMPYLFLIIFYEL